MAYTMAHIARGLFLVMTPALSRLWQWPIIDNGRSQWGSMKCGLASTLCRHCRPLQKISGYNLQTAGLGGTGKSEELFEVRRAQSQHHFVLLPILIPGSAVAVTQFLHTSFLVSSSAILRSNYTNGLSCHQDQGLKRSFSLGSASTHTMVHIVSTKTRTWLNTTHQCWLVIFSIKPLHKRQDLVA